MNPHLHLVSRTFASRVAELGFAANLPVDWISHELPAEEVDFSNPANFLALAVIAAPHAAIIFAFAARPAYDDGTLQDWAEFHLRNNGLQPVAIGHGLVAGVPAVLGEAQQASELGPMLVRFAFLEDGNRLLNLTLTAPEMLADSVRDAWFAMLGSFTLETPRGSRFTPGSKPTPSPPSPEPAVAGTPSTPELPASEVTAPGPVCSQPGPSESNGVATESETPPDAGVAGESKNPFSQFALSTEPASLDPDEPMNANLRDRGIGLVPRCVSTDAAARTARLAAGAILAEFEVPFGWHVIDDGRRTLVFEPTGKIQISLNLIPTDGRTPEIILDEIEAEMRRDYGAPEFMRGTQGRVHALGARNLSVNGESIEQYHLLVPHRQESLALRARVTTSPERSTDACNLAELIIDSCQFPGV